jgi:hypothetical protein
VPAVLAVFNWPKNTDRYRRVQRFTEALFTNWERWIAGVAAFGACGTFLVNLARFVMEKLV